MANKYADIIDNSAEIAHQDVDFAVVFLKECQALLKRIDKGNPELYRRAMETVQEGLKHVKRCCKWIVVHLNRGLVY